jgi:anti-anti-sigma factor
MLTNHSIQVDLDPRVHGAAVIRLNGSLEAAAADQLLRMGERLVAAGQRELVLDCSGLDFCDPHGLRAALTLAALVRPDGVVTLEHPPRILLRLLQVTGADSCFELSDAQAPEPCPWPDRSLLETSAA